MDRSNYRNAYFSSFSDIRPIFSLKKNSKELYTWFWKKGKIVKYTEYKDYSFVPLKLLLW
jgi:hypothetical protein